MHNFRKGIIEMMQQLLPALVIRESTKTLLVRFNAIPLHLKQVLIGLLYTLLSSWGS